MYITSDDDMLLLQNAVGLVITTANNLAHCVDPGETLAKDGVSRLSVLLKELVVSIIGGSMFGSNIRLHRASKELKV